MKINNLRIENCQRIKLVELSPSRNLFIIGGNNAQGKTSIQTAIKMLLGGKRAHTEDPVRHGADKAVIEATTDTGYTFTKEILPDGKTVFKARGANGEALSQSFVKTLYNTQTIDPLQFAELDSSAQRKVLLDVLGVDTTSIDNQIKGLFEDRTLINREVSDLSSKIDGVREHRDVPESEISSADIARKVQQATQQLNEANALTAQISALEADIAQKTAQLQELRIREAEMPPAPDLSSLEDSLANLDQINQKIRENKKLAELRENYRFKSGQADTLTRKIEGLRAEKEEILANANLPIPGLSFNDREVLYNDVPFSQASAAERLRVSTAMGMAINPELKLLLIQDGSLLDENSLKALEQMANERDYLILLERVGKGAECDIIIEDGEVVGRGLPEYLTEDFNEQDTNTDIEYRPRSDS